MVLILVRFQKKAIQPGSYGLGFKPWMLRAFARTSLCVDFFFVTIRTIYLVNIFRFIYASYTCNKVTKLFCSNNLTNRLLGLIFFQSHFVFFFALNINSGPIVLG